MSEHSEALPLPEAERFDPKHAGRLPTLCLGAGVVGLVCSLLGLLFVLAAAVRLLLAVRVSPTSSPCASAACSGSVCIMQPMPIGRWWFAGSWRTWRV